MDLITVVGLIAAICTTTSFLPQVIQSWRTRSTKDISLPMYAVLVVGVFLWLVYGVLINKLPIILANGITLALALSILFIKIKCG
ncbi:MAG: SemiSWEET transporter [Candidatus Aenigmarchaeota archaeon]|nr:SemiSWEET transporter [Candidatus Aenigmarchaeota archaeon]